MILRVINRFIDATICAIVGISYNIIHILINQLILPHYNIIVTASPMKSTLGLNPDLDTYCSVCCPQLLSLTRIIMYEFVASLIYTYCVMVSYGTNPADFTHTAYLSLAMLLCFVICGQLSGGHGNMIITIALLFTKGSNVTFLNCLVYIVTQFAGALIGGVIAYGTVNTYGYPFPIDGNTPKAFGGQLMGSFMFVVFYLFIMSASTKMQSNFWCYILVPCAFYICRMLTEQYSGLNPSAVLANQIFYGAKYNNYHVLEVYWAYIVGPIVGAFIGTIFFNYFCLPLHQRWANRHNNDKY